MSALPFPKPNGTQKTSLVAIAIAAVSILVSVTLSIGKTADRFDAIERRIDQLERVKESDHALLIPLRQDMAYVRQQTERLAQARNGDPAVAR
jgi:hypothetical protein